MTEGPLKTVDSFAVGDRAEAVGTVSDAHLVAYAALTGAQNPLVLDTGAARDAGLADRAVPGMLLAGYATAALTALVAPGAVTAGHEFHFPAAARPGDTITSVCEVEAIDRDQRLVTVRMRCTTQRGECVLDGLAYEKYARPKPAERAG
ncbi:MAG: MaoC family dehydratase N-terminal domain-containing protein [Candidatus Rokubacteria bacterium]|nr:MaoC family dehydratase N-terminal domain-containing protein [Candidatus Rokubacteria bacterium]